ncbi:MAG: MprA protease, GlyGly-CTERM protein-sorting domain-containing form [Cupriavidus sp.]|jgi:serine protease|uniref:MprA protease, GlyGly-CTERM protein-sorting domain-containing form n=1 Tax=Cupriavidus pauculus TaxID=82633 RepID=UPI000C4E8809|nr:MprA protease, GlyGly-CTERM protein-sorting domain-containing form [Cupriavidus pauculus]MBU68363.1 MprA protease, GlyGly-CTERM protein-sorting domain-containing form [Cupriavidus sp.]MCM3606900.1 MprA protease, GlyGly-CTERM protein-sorting domain-containing form [Cupriavidus pauculus]
MPYAKLKYHRSIVPALLVATAALLGAPGAAQADAPVARQAPVYTGNYIVRWRDGSQTVDTSADTTRMRRVESNTGLALSVKRPMAGALQLLTVKDNKGDDPETVAKRLREDPRVADAVPDRWLRLHDTVPNDPDFAAKQLYMQSPATVVGGANLPRAWDRSRGSASVVIAVVDTGYLPHPDLAGRLVQGYDFISSTTVSVDGDGRDSDPTDPGDYVPNGTTCSDGSGASNSTWHGTRVASVLGAATNNSQGIAGVDWTARIQPVRVSGRCGALLSDTVDGMRWAGGLSVPGVPNNTTPARIINISLGGGTCSSIEQQAVNDLNAAGAIVVAAAGNSAGAVEAPADCSGVIAVTAHANDGENASYANVGPQVTLSAPGGGCGNSKVIVNSSGQPVSCASPAGQSFIRTLSNTGTASPGAYTTTDSQGTSFAAPMVSGVAAMMLAVNPSLTPAQVTTVLKNTARAHPANTFCTASGNSGKCGAGLLDADAALALAPNPPAVGSSSGSSSGGTDGGGGGGGGGAFSPWSAVCLLLIGLGGFALRRKV